MTISHVHGNGRDGRIDDWNGMTCEWRTCQNLMMAFVVLVAMENAMMSLVGWEEKDDDREGGKKGRRLVVIQLVL